MTFNSAHTLERTLASVVDFAEIVIADGGSTDDTLAIARRYGCKIIAQDPAFLDPGGRIADFSAVRNQNIAASGQPWIFRIDSDDWATPELVAQISEVCRCENSSSFFRVGAVYERKGRQVDCAASYPMFFVRLFRREAGEHSGGVNENVIMDSEPGTLTGAFVIPIQPLRVAISKWWFYLRIELREVGNLDRNSREARVREARSAIRWFAERWRESRAICEGQRLPSRHEASRVAYLATRFALLLAFSKWRNLRPQTTTTESDR